MTGQRFGLLTAIAPVRATQSYGYGRWLCLCECGRSAVREARVLRRAMDADRPTVPACDVCIRDIRVAMADATRAESPQARGGRPARAVHCPRCGEIGLGARWLYRHRAESPECDGRRRRQTSPLPVDDPKSAKPENR